MSAAVYLHPEDAGLTFDAQTRCLTCWNDGQSVTVPIGSLGLIEAGHAMLALGEAGRVHGADGTPGALTPDNLAEHAGAAGFAVQLVDVMLRGLRNLPTLDAGDAP